jgi:hypothetical protein
MPEKDHHDIDGPVDRLARPEPRVEALAIEVCDVDGVP